jgi:hypothetical protein
VSDAAVAAASGARREGDGALLLVREARLGGTSRRPGSEEVVLLPILGGAPAGMELGGLSSELVSSAWCGATIFGSSGWPPSAPVVRWWLEAAAGGMEVSDDFGGSLDIGQQP